MDEAGLLTSRYASKIAGVLGCFDRIVITGTLPDVAFSDAISKLLYFKGIRIFDYARQFAEPFRDAIRANAEKLAADNGIEIEFIRSQKAIRKESHIQAIVERRGSHPGLIHILSAMETCASYEPWHDKPSGRTFLRFKESKCLHYYFYFIDPEFGLCYMRVPTWCPFRLQFYCNGHNWLANQLRKRGIGFQQLDNTFTQIDDWATAQALATAFPVPRLHRALDKFASRYCPVVKQFRSTYHWSLMQVEYATDIVFKQQRHLQPLYDSLVHTAIHAVKPTNVATFLGRKLHPNYQDELGNDFHTRIEGTRIKHHMGPVAIKMYDKAGLVLRLETTVNDVTFFKHHRKVEHRNGQVETRFAAMQKTIYSLGALRELLDAANGRYLAFLSRLIDPSAGVRKVERLAETVRKNERTYPGFNVFQHDDLKLFTSLARGEWNISGFHNASLRRFLVDKSAPQVSRLLKRLRLHGMIKKIGHTYKYYMTQFGQEVLLTALKLRELVVIPTLAGVPT